MYRDMYRDMYSDIVLMNGVSCDLGMPQKVEVEKKPVKRFHCVNDYFNDSSDSDSDEEAAAATPIKRRKNEPFIRYNKSFLTYAFVEHADRKTPYPECMICGIVLPNRYMKMSKLRRHFMKKHAESSDKPTTFFESNLDALHMKQEIPE